MFAQNIHKEFPYERFIAIDVAIRAQIFRKSKIYIHNENLTRHTQRTKAFRIKAI